MGRRLLFVFLQIAAVVVFLVSALHLVTLLSVFGGTLDEVAKASGDGLMSGRSTALLVWSLLVGKECLTLAVAIAAFRYASQKRRGSVRPT
jgi:hypothetical protein